ncbi:MAG: chloride channel protein [Jatrophihabitans sp.]|uniref:chloride channel protein n=1 Tax=Jatrophihabitans sp. TaxID=1932789 RepID=UPI003F8145DB
MTGRGAIRLLIAVIGTGVASGLAGVTLTLLLHAVQHVAFGYTEATFLTGVERAPAWRRVVAVAAGGALAGAGWWLYRRRTRENVSVTHALGLRDPRLAAGATTSDAVLQIVAVGAGASLGREGAPRQVGAALADLVGRRTGVTVDQRRMLLAIGAGAALAAVYNVPLGGAAFALELLITSRRRAAVLPTIAACALATVIAWPVLGDSPTYHVPGLRLTASVLVAAVPLGIVSAVVGTVFRAVMTAAREHAPSGWRAAVVMPVAFAALGATAIAYPQLLGNGKNLAELCFNGSVSLGLACVLVLLKPAATALCLRSGAIGGLLTPSFATGAALGLAFGEVWSHLWPADAAALAVAGAAGVLASAQRAPITAVVLTLDFTHAPVAMAAPIVLCTATAVVAARLIPAARRFLSGRRDRRHPDAPAAVA